MASIKELLFTVKAKAEGVKGTTQQTDKMADSIERSDKARKGAGKGQNSYNKREKALHQSNLSSAKGFSKMNQTIGGGSSGLVGAYATLAANVFAATAAFNALKRAAQLDVLVEGLEYVGNAAGRNLPYISNQLKEITGNAISAEDSMRGVALGVSAGFSSEQMEKLTKVAKGAALALGRDMGDAMSRLTRGAAKLEPEILDELGIMVRLDEATEEYATQIGKSVSALTTYERRMAFVNAINREGLEKFSGIAEAIEPSAYDKLSAALADLAQEGLRLINGFLGPLIKLMSGSSTVLIGTVTLLGSTISRQMLPALYGVSQRAAQAAESEAELAKASAKTASTANEAAKASVAKIKISDDMTEGMQEQINVQGKSNDQAKESVRTYAKLDSSSRSYQHNVNAMNKALKEKGATEKNIDQDVLRRGKSGIAGLERNAAARDQVKASIDAEAAAKHRNTQATNANAVAQNKANTASAYAMAKISTLIPGWKLLTQVMRENTAAILANTGAGFNATKMWAFMKVGIMRTAMAVRFLGTALLSAIPIIGMVVIAWGFLKEAWEHFFPEDAVTAATDKAVEGLESILEANEQLRQSLEDTNDTVRKTELTYNVFAGVLQNIADMSSGLQEAASDEAAGNAAKAKETIAELEKDITSLQTFIDTKGKDAGEGELSGVRGMLTPRNLLLSDMDEVEVKLATYNQALSDTEKTLEKVLAGEKLINTEIEKTNVKRFLEKAILMLDSSDALGGKQKGMVKELTDLKIAVEKGNFAWSDYHKIMGRLGDEQTGYLNGLNNAEQATNQLSRETNKLAQIVTTPYDKSIDAMKSMLTSYDHVEGAAKDATKAIADEGERDIARKAHVIELTAAIDAKLKLASKEGPINKKILEDTLVILEKQQEILRVYKSQIKELKVQKDFLKGAAKEIPKALKLQLELQNEINKVERRGVEASIISNENLMSAEHAFAANVEHQAELVALQNDYISGQEINLQGKLKEAELAAKMFKWESKAYAMRKSTQDLAQEEFGLQIRLENLTSGRARLGKEVSAGQEMAIAEAQNNLELSRIDAEMEMAKKKARLDYDILRLQFELLQMQIKERLERKLQASKETKDLLDTSLKEVGPKELADKAVEDAEAQLAALKIPLGGLTGTPTLKEENERNAQITAQAKILKDAKAHAIVVQSVIDKANREMPILEKNIATLPGVIQESSESFAEIFPLLLDQYNATVDNIEKKAIVARLRLTVDNLQLAQDLRNAITASITGSATDLGSSMGEIADRMYGELEARRQAARQLAESDLKAKGVMLATGDTRAALPREITEAGQAAADKVEKLDLGVLEYMQIATSLSAGMIENLKELGPGGEVVAAVIEGALMIGTAWTTAFEQIKQVGASMKDRLKDNFDSTKSNFSQMNLEEKAAVVGAALSAVASTIGAIANIKAKQSQEAMAATDREIAAEKKRDGKSKESLAKIAKLEQKKEAQKKKAWEVNKKMMLGQAIMSTAAGIAQAIPNFVLMAIVAAMGAMQIATIAGTTYQGGGSAPATPAAPSKIDIGGRSNKVDIAAGRSNVMGELAYLRGEKGIGSNARDFRPGGFAGRKYRAAGGFVVGEQGPELLVPQMPGQVLSQSDAAGIGAPVNVTFQINAMDTANMEDMLESRRGSIINMIRGAANEHGQDFLEMIDTDTYNEEQRAAGGPMRSYE